jgi:hypothetical protein
VRAGCAAGSGDTDTASSIPWPAPTSALSAGWSRPTACRRRHLHRLLLAAGAAAIRLPADAVEAARARHLPNLDPPPVFILGHWRSGTTHLYNLLSRSPDFVSVPPLAVGLPWTFMGLGGFWRRRLEECLPEDRLIDTMPVHPDSPQEDELALANMQPLSWFHGLFFPRRMARGFARGLFLDDCTPDERERWLARLSLFLRKVQAGRPGLPLLVKNPAHSARVAALRRLWPDARFIHIHRDPVAVYQSTRRMLRTILRELALQDWSEDEVDALVLDTYPKLMGRLAADTADLPPQRLVELRFADFERAPLAQAERLYRQLGLDGFERARPAFERYLAEVAGWSRTDWAADPATLALLDRRWGPQAARWGYRIGSGPAP